MVDPFDSYSEFDLDISFSSPTKADGLVAAGDTSEDCGSVGLCPTKIDYTCLSTCNTCKTDCGTCETCGTCNTDCGSCATCNTCVTCGDTCICPPAQE